MQGGVGVIASGGDGVERSSRPLGVVHACLKYYPLQAEKRHV